MSLGRLIRFHPDRNGSAEILLDGLFFPNGVALTPDEQSLLWVETGTGRVHRLDLKTKSDKIILDGFDGAESASHS